MGGSGSEEGGREGQVSGVFAGPQSISRSTSMLSGV
jgi:hypothetical protein